jgi:peptidoglycan hydrolase CwlO-like protein
LSSHVTLQKALESDHEAEVKRITSQKHSLIQQVENLKVDHAKLEAETKYLHTQVEEQKRHRKEAEELVHDLKGDISVLKEDLMKERAEHKKETEKSISLASQKDGAILRLKEEIRRHVEISWFYLFKVQILN